MSSEKDKIEHLKELERKYAASRKYCRNFLLNCFTDFEKVQKLKGTFKDFQ